MGLTMLSYIALVSFSFAVREMPKTSLFFKISTTVLDLQVYQWLFFPLIILTVWNHRRLDKIFTQFVVLAFIMEMMVAKIAKLGNGNHEEACLYTLICIVFYLCYYAMKMSTKMDRIFTVVVISAWVVFAIFNQYSLQKGLRFGSLNYAVGIVASLILLFVYIRRKILSGDTWYWRKDSALWLGVGIVMFSIPQVPILIHLETLVFEQPDYVLLPIMDLLTFGNIFLMFGYLMVAFTSAERLPWTARKYVTLN